MSDVKYCIYQKFFVPLRRESKKHLIMAQKKVLCIVRTSTERQEVISQQEDLKRFIKTKGFNEEEVEWLISAGASARSVNKKYLDYLDDIMRIIKTTPSIRTVAMWSMSRLGRREDYLQIMKRFFVDNGVQCYIKEPSVTLLNEKGELDTGASLAFSVFAATVQIDTKESHERMIRGKHYNMSVGKYVGGPRKYGYRINENNYYQIVEEEAKVIKNIFAKFSTGDYSITTLWKELKERGILRDGKTFTLIGLRKMIDSKVYVGDKAHPAIISKDLFDKCQQVKKDHLTFDTLPKKKDNIGSMIWKCPKCMHSMSYCTGYYRCTHHYSPNYKDCEYTSTFSVDVVDAILWDEVIKAHVGFLCRDSSETQQELKEKLEATRDKIEALNKQINGTFDERLKRIAEAYADMALTREEYTSRKKKILEDKNSAQSRLTTLQEEEGKYKAMLKEQEGRFKTVRDLFEYTNSMTNAERQTLARRYVKYGTLNKNGDLSIIEIHMYNGEYETFYYYAHKVGAKLFYGNNKTPYVPLRQRVRYLPNKSLSEIRKSL